jgi:hypothetical protein
MALTKVTYAMIEGAVINPDDYGSLADAITAAIAQNNVVGLLADTTVRVPTDAATLQIAFDRVTPLSAQTQIDVVIQTGHQPASGVSVSNGDYSQWQVSSVDPTVTLALSFTGRFINCNNGMAPTLNTYVIGHSGVDRIYSMFGSTGKVNANCGGEGTSGRILYGNAATIQAADTIWKNFGDSVYFSAGSSVQLSSALLEGATVTSNGALTCSRGSSIEAQGITIKDCWFAVECKRAGSSINMHDATIENIGRLGIRATRGGNVSFDGGTITDLAPAVDGAGIESFSSMISAQLGVSVSFTSAAPSGEGYGVRAAAGGVVACAGITIVNARTGIYADNGGRADASNCVIDGATEIGAQARQGSSVNVNGGTVINSGTNDLRVTEGAIIAANLCTTTNGVGAPNVIDTNLDGFGGLNSVGTNGRGIIFG